MGMNDMNSLSHTRWNCKYHIVFAPKYRRKVFYKEKRTAIGKILRQLCEWKGVKIIEAEACPNHIHLYVEIPPKISVSHFMGYLKGKSSTMLYEQFGELDSVYLRSSQNSQPNSDASDVNSRKERGRVFRIARSDPPPAF